MILCSLIILATLSTNAHKILDVIIDRNIEQEKPKVRVGNIQYSRNTSADKLNSNNLFNMPLVLNKKRELLHEKLSKAA